MNDRTTGARARPRRRAAREARPLPAASLRRNAPAGAGRFGRRAGARRGDRDPDLPGGALRRRGANSSRRVRPIGAPRSRREVTIQVRPHPQRDMEADVARAADLARAHAGVEQARALHARSSPSGCSSPGSEPGLDFGDLPVPRLIVLKLARRREAGFRAACARRLRERGARPPPSTTTASGCRGCRRWPTPSSRSASPSSRSSSWRPASRSPSRPAARWSGNREVVEVLHFVGANDDYIAREFQRRFFRSACRAAPSGAGAALVLTLVLGWIAARSPGEPGRRPDRGPVRLLRHRLARAPARRPHRARRSRPHRHRVAADGETVS